MDLSTFSITASIAIGLWVLHILNSLFGPELEYKVGKDLPDVHTPEFMAVLESVTAGKMRTATSAEVLTNGENFYKSQLEAIRAAKQSIHLEVYIFQKGRVAQDFLTALTERAQAGVEVRVVIDGIGSLTTRDSYFRELREAGGQVCWYHPVRWHTLMRLNNRTHRELLIVDGKIGFIGGAAIADHWLYPKKKHTRWRDTVVRVEGEVVAGLQSTFIENWVEASGELLAAKKYYPSDAETKSQTLVISSTPSAGASTRARMLYQVLLATAEESIFICSPYFLPDKSGRKMLAAAARRGISVKIVVPGAKSDHSLTRTSSRRLYGDLLEAGAEIYEYQPSMIHAKILLIDGRWSVVGSTNFDYRSFSINDEVNLAVCDKPLATRLTQDFMADIADSKMITLQAWKRRSIFERTQEYLGWVLQKQQ
ncbi:MAG: cardiolipin synthase [Terriglobales bacterium]